MSEEDIRFANDTTIIYLIYAVDKDKIKTFTVTREKEINEVPVEIAEANTLASADRRARPRR